MLTSPQFIEKTFMTRQATKPFILIDGSSYLYRAFHAMPSLSNSKGVHTGAIYGMINMLRKLIADYDPDHVVVVFDAKGKTFRDDLFPQYKANRSSMPLELVQQIEPIHAAIKAMGLPILMIEGVEADDVIGTLAILASQQGRETLISTGDKDLAQLVNEHVTLVNTMTDTLLNPQTVQEKFGVPPERIVDYLTLVGDSVDNIPGVPQVGPKTAVKWLAEFGSLDNVVANAATIKGKVGENLRATLLQLPLTKTLVTIKSDVNLSVALDDLKRQSPDIESLIKIYQELEFKNWLAELLAKNTSATTTPTSSHYTTILTPAEFALWLTKLEQANLVALEIETNDVSDLQSEIIGIGFATTAGNAAYLPLGHNVSLISNQLDIKTSLALLKPLLENPELKKIGHHVKHSQKILANYDIELRGVIYDTMLESYVLDSSNSNHEIDTLALKYLGHRTLTLTDIAGKGMHQIPLHDIAIDKATDYTAGKAAAILQLHEALWSRISELSGLKQIFETIELPLTPVLARMERIGVLINADMLKQQSTELQQRLVELEELTFNIAGSPFNLNSPKQLQEILFTRLQLPILQKTPTGQPSTADAVLQELALDYPLPKLIIEYRSLSKLISTYTNRLPEQINSKSGRIHTSYNQTGAATGRLSSSDPNLQNIPIRTQEGRRIRQAFIAPPGFKIVSADYSQIELRIMAHISNDPTLLQAFKQNLDIHKATAAEVLGIELEQVSYEERRRAKAINFGLIYGMSAFGLAKQLGIDRHTSQLYIDKYFQRYPKIKDYMENTRNEAHAKGYVETLWGRRLYLPDINSSQMLRQKAAERTAINAPLQGSAADIIKRAMLLVDRWLQTTPIQAKMIMQVHDELVFEVADADVVPAIDAIRHHMMAAATLQIPLIVDVGVGNNWDEAAES